MRLSDEEILAAATGSTGGYGKISTVPAAGVIYVRCDCTENTGRVIWEVLCNKANAVQLYRARTNVLGGTLTLTDATAVDDGDTFVLNGLTFTAETTEGDASAAARKWYHASQAAGSVALAALLTNATYGVPGITATAAAVDTTDVITIAATDATVLQFGQGTSASNEIAWAETSLASLVRDGAPWTGVAADTTTGGVIYEQYIDGWPYAYLGLTNNDAVNAATVVIKATRIAA